MFYKKVILVVFLAIMVGCTKKNSDSNDRSNMNQSNSKESNSNRNANENSIESLSEACARNDLATVKRLLLLGADPNERTRDQEGETLTPLLIAIGVNNAMMVDELINYGASVDVVYKGITAEELILNFVEQNNE